jgi:hypothetical protein
MRKYIGHIPLTVIIVLLINAIYRVLVSNIIFSYEHYIGLSGIILSIVLFFIKPIFAKVVTGIVLLLATFSIAAFTPIIEYNRIGVSGKGFGVDIKIQIYCMLLLLLFTLLNLDLGRKLRQDKIKVI